MHLATSQSSRFAILTLVAAALFCVAGCLGNSTGGGSGDGDGETEGVGALEYRPSYLQFTPETDRPGLRPRLVLTNVGADDVRLLNVSLQGPDAASFSLEGGITVGETIAPGEERGISIEFVGAFDRAHDATLSVTTNVPGDSRIEVPVIAPDLSMGPAIQVSPNRVALPSLSEGETASTLFSVENIGSEDLSVTDVRLEESGDVRTLSFVDTVERTVDIAPGGGALFRVEYAPVDGHHTSGELVIESDAQLLPVARVPIRAPRRAADLSIPASISFGAGTPPGESVDRVVSGVNAGGDDLLIEGARVRGTDDFEVSFPTSADAPPSEDRATPPDRIVPLDAFDVRVTYTPSSSEFASGELVFETNEPSGQTVVELYGNNSSACMALPDGRTVDFGDATGSTELTVENCSGVVALSVERLEIVDDGNGAFSLGDLPAIPASIEPDDTLRFQVNYNASRGPANGQLVIESSDPANSSETIELNGR